MKLHITKTNLLVTSVFALVLVGVPSFAISTSDSHAHAEITQTTDQSHTTGDQTTENDTNSTTNARTEQSQTKSQVSERQAISKTRLTAAKLKVCQNREKAIGNIMNRIADRGQKHIDLFTTIATRVEAFYTNKGNLLANYDNLVADVNAKQATAQQAVDTIKAHDTSFSCSSDDPKGMVTNFQDNLKSELSVLKDYKTSVKDLIVQVKSVQGTSTLHTDQNATKGNE